MGTSSSAISKILQVSPDELVELGRLLRLLAQLGGQAGHLLLERLAVVLDLGGADVAAGREDVAVLANIVERGALAEAGHIGVLRSLTLPARLLVAAPRMVGGGDLRN